MCDIISELDIQWSDYSSRDVYNSPFSHLQELIISEECMATIPVLESDTAVDASFALGYDSFREGIENPLQSYGMHLFDEHIFNKY